MKVLAPPAEGKPAHENPYAAQHFHYDPQQQTGTCPQGRRLDYEGHTTKKGQRVERYRCHGRDCPMREACSGDPKGRQIEIWPHTAEVQAMRKRLQEAGPRARWSRRGEIIKRRFGHIKQHDGFRRWTVWGLEAVKTQWTLLCATLNLRVLYARWRHGRLAPTAWPAAMLASVACWPSHSSRPLPGNPVTSASIARTFA